MKLTFSSIAIASLGFLSTTASAWTLDLYGVDGRHIHTHGHEYPVCNNIAFTPVIDVGRAEFNQATDFLLDPDTFELYVDEGCQGLSYRNDNGSYDLTPARLIRSYQIL